MSRDDPFLLVLCAFAGVGILMMFINGASMRDVTSSVGSIVLLGAAGFVGYHLLKDGAFAAWLGDADMRELQKRRIENIVQHSLEGPFPYPELVPAVARLLKEQAQQKPIPHAELFERAYLAARPLVPPHPDRDPQDASIAINVAAIIVLRMYPQGQEILRSQLKKVPAALLLSYLPQYRARLSPSDAAWPRPRP
jgi:hypothetical protein